jgi:hypothetical protein
MTVATAIRIDGPMMPARLARLGRERHQCQGDQRIDDGPDHDLVGDALRQEGGRFYKSAGQCERRIVGQRGNKGGEHECHGPAAASGRDMGRHRAVGDFRQSQMREQGRFQQAIEHADQERDKADQRDQRADLLSEPDLIVGWTRRAAL